MSIPKLLDAYPATDQWIGFDANNQVTIKTGRVEIGQGITAALTRVAATELSVDPDQIRVVAGDTTLCPNEGLTVGSLSVQVGSIAIRWATSAARHELLDRAAQLLQTDAGELEVDRGVITKDGAETGLSYWTLLETAPLEGAVIDWASPLPFSQHPEFIPDPRRQDILARLRGEVFIHDMVFQNLLHGRVIQPPHGANALLTPEDRIAALAGNDVALFRDGFLVGVTSDCELAANRAAIRLREKLEWKWPSSSINPLAELNHATDARTLSLEIGTRSADPLPFCVSVTRPCIAHASIGPCCALAVFEDGCLQVWSHSQGVFVLRESLAAVMDMSVDAVIVRFAPGAGCYGHNGADDVALDAAILARANPGRHVRVIWSREDEFRAGPLGPAMRTTASASLSPDGRISGVRVDIQSPAHSTRPRGSAAPNLRSAQFLGKPTPIAPPLDSPAAAGGGSDRNAVPIYTFDALEVWKSPPSGLAYRPSALRGLGTQINVCAIEGLMDELAAAAHTDPVDFRLKHLADPRARKVVERVAEMSNLNVGSEEKARGLGFARYKNSAAYCAVVAEIEIGADVQVCRLWAAVDAGEAIEPSGLCNQIEGGIVQAVSITMMEKVNFGPNGVETSGWDDYPILGFSQVPSVEISLIDNANAPPLGVGEAAVGPTTAAILNAVSNGLGQRIMDLPLSRENLTKQLTA